MPAPGREAGGEGPDAAVREAVAELQAKDSTRKATGPWPRAER